MIRGLQSDFAALHLRSAPMSDYGRHDSSFPSVTGESWAAIVPHTAFATPRGFANISGTPWALRQAWLLAIAWNHGVTAKVPLPESYADHGEVGEVR